ncbi:MAG: hypothetical protein MUC85_01970 [Anaerolineales bacterium]|nr:hypothetical protein [Anaerolineales bacterium]
MITFFAAQHVFSSVPAEQSPLKKRGYQTLGYTSALTPEVVRQIEDRCLYGGSEGSPTKQQYYPLQNHFFAISQTVPLSELDEFGRKGRYLSHTLVIDQKTFSALGSCPIDVLRQYPFMTQLDSVFRQMKPGSQDLPPASYQINPEWHLLPEQNRSRWDRQVLQRASRLAWQVQRLMDERLSTALYGSPEEKWGLIAWLFAVARPQERRLLSFDTWAQGCDWAPNIFFWLQGYPQGERGRLSQWVDASNGQMGDFFKSPDPSPYGGWMEAEGISYDLASLARFQPLAESLERSILSPTGAERTPSFVTEEFLQRFAQISAPAVAQAWLKHLPAGLSESLLSRFRAAVSQQPGTYLRILHQGVCNEDVYAFLFQQLYALQAVPARSDRGILEKFIQTSRVKALESLVALWNKKEKEWAKTLAAVDANDYQYIIACVAGWADPPLPVGHGIVGQHVEIWLSQAARALPDKDWKKTLDLLASQGDSSVNALARYISLLSPQAQQEISQWLDKYEGPSIQLRAWFPQKPKKKILGLF